MMRFRTVRAFRAKVERDCSRLVAPAARRARAEAGEGPLG